MFFSLLKYTNLMCADINQRKLFFNICKIKNVYQDCVPEKFNVC